MKRLARALLSLSMLALFLSPVSASAVSANPTPDCSAGTTCTITFAYTGDYYSWTVPSGVTSLTVDVQGAQGGGDSSSNYRGKGGRVQGTLTVTSGATIYIYVGGSGTNSNTSAAVTAGGWNGGGAGGRYATTGGGGGGGSDIRIGGTALTDRKVVAGGAGGFGFNGPSTAGGHGGGLNAQWVYGTSGCVTSTATSFTNEGTTCEQPTAFGSVYFGGGGTQTGGGHVHFANGSGTGLDGWSGGAAGSLGVGGDGGMPGACGGVCPGGGGGGGYYGGAGGGAGPGGGGSSYTDPVLVSSVTHTRGYRAANGQVLLTYLNSPIPTTFSTSQSTPTNISTSGTITYSLVLSQSVSDLVAADFQFGGTATCNTPGLSGSGTNYTVTVTNCTEGTLILQLKANSVTGTSTGPPTVSSANTIAIDRTGPTVSSVTAPANKTYIPSDTPTFTVNFSESVTVTGTPRLNLTVGLAATKFAYYVSMSDSKTALFRYTVGTTADEYDTDGIGLIGAIDQISGSFSDLAGNSMASALFTPPTLTSVLVAQPASAPTITSITATTTQLSVAFTAGAANGSTTTSYQYSTNNGGTWNNRASGTTASPLVITGLTDGTGYTVRLRAVTNAGYSDSSTAVTETPTAVAVTGDTTLVITYGSSGSTSSYSATGGTGSYTWTLGSSLTGITISGSTVTAGVTTPAGTYTQTVRATDGNSQVGSKTLTITVYKASTSITIALPGSASSAALGGAVTITATVPRAGAVNFKLGGTTISGCGAAAVASTTATCSWTPAALGSASLTAVFTPTDSSNYETSTTTTLTITVVNGVSTVTLALAGGVTQPPKGQAINIVATIDQAGKVSFFSDGKRIPGCYNMSATVGNKSCLWKPAVQKQVNLTATLNPTNNVYNNSTSSLTVWVVRRTGTR